MAKHGKYLSIEGTDGTGKSTQVRLIREKLAAVGIDSIEFHEPEDSRLPITSALRRIIKDGTLDRLPMTNVLMFAAARHEIWHRDAELALRHGKWVIGARSYLSTLVYQGDGEGIDHELITDITRNTMSEQYMHPDGEVILHTRDGASLQKRIDGRGALDVPDQFEQRGDDFQSKLTAGYLKIAASHDIPLVDAIGTEEAVNQRIIAELRRQIPDFVL